jgi:hypothetical protein
MFITDLNLPKKLSSDPQFLPTTNSEFSCEIAVPEEQQEQNLVFSAPVLYKEGTLFCSPCPFLEVFVVQV